MEERAGAGNGEGLEPVTVQAPAEGVLAPHAKLRPRVVAIGRAELPAVAPEPSADLHSPGRSPEPGPAAASPARIRWAVLLARTYQVLPLFCPACSGQMRILAVAWSGTRVRS